MIEQIFAPINIFLLAILAMILGFGFYALRGEKEDNKDKKRKV